MKLYIDNINVKVKKANQKEHNALSNSMAFHVPNYQHMPRYKMGMWDGKKRFYHKGYKTFPTGLLSFVFQLAKKKKFKVKAIDKRIPFPISKKRINKYKKKLRDYQKIEIDKILASTLKGLKWIRGIVKHPTRSGKTFVCAALAGILNRPTLVIVGNLSLLYQTQADFKKILKHPIGVIGDSHFKIEKVTISTIQTLWARKDRKVVQDYIASIDVLILDECHHDSNKGIYHNIIDACPAYYRFGFSGTPLSRGDLGDIQLIGDTGEIISTVKRKYLEKHGWISIAKVQIKKIEFPTLKPRMQYQKAYKIGIVENQERNAEIIAEAKSAHFNDKVHVLILVKRLKHGYDLVNWLRGEGVKTVFIHGESSIDKRKKILKKMKSSDNPIVAVATSVFDEGVTMPEIRKLIMAGGGASRNKSIQRVSRGLNSKADGENILDVLDFEDNIHPILEEHSMERIAAYTQEGFKVMRDE